MVSFSTACKVLLVLPSLVVGTNYPVGITNCHMSSWIDKAPERVVVASSGAVEIMLALGLGDKIEASCWVKEVWPPLNEEFEKFKHYPKYPNHTELLEHNPDFIYATYSSAFASDRINYTEMLEVDECSEVIETNVYGSNKTYCRQELEDAGIGTYLSTGYCERFQHRPEKPSVVDLFQEIRNIGTIFDIQEKAHHLIGEIEEDFELAKGISSASSASVADVQPLRVLWFDMYNGTNNPQPEDPQPYIGACCGGPQLILDHAGAINVFADEGLEDRRVWSYVNYSAFADADPDLIVVVELTTETAADKIYQLCTDPRSKDMTAVKQRAFIYVPFAASNVGVRMGKLAYNLAEAMKALAHGTPLNSLQFTSDPDSGLYSSLSQAKIFKTLPKITLENGTVIDLEKECPGSNRNIEIKDFSDLEDLYVEDLNDKDSSEEEDLGVKDLSEEEDLDDEVPLWAVYGLVFVGLAAGFLLLFLCVVVNREKGGKPMFSPVVTAQAS